MANNNSAYYEQQEKTARASFLMGIPGFLGLIATLAMTWSVVTLVDFLDTACNLICDGFVCFLSSKLKNNLKYEFNYGVSRIESLSSLCCDSIMIAGLIIVLASSIKELLEPSGPSGILVVALICKIGAVLADSYVLYKKYRIIRISNTGMAKVALAGAVKNLAFDVMVLFCYIISCVFSNVPATYYINPILCILIAFFLGYQSIRRIIANVWDLTDRTLDEETQFKIIKVLNKYFDDYAGFKAVKTHKIDDLLYVDLQISFDDEKTFKEIVKFKKDMENDLKEEIGKCRLSVIVY